MGFLDSIFGSTSKKNTNTTSTTLPKWVDNAAQANYKTAVQIASRPYTAYPYQRVAGFTNDQRNAMNMLANYAPGAMANAAAFKAPRLIDEVGPGGTIEAYMNPYIDQVLNRTQNRIREATNMSRQWDANMGAQQAGAFGDARHGISDALIEEKGINQMRDAAAEAYAAAYDNALGLRQYDINNMYNTEQMNAAKQQQFLEYIDALYRSGSNQQALDQKSLELAYQDFLRQQDYPIDQYNLLVAGLNNSPYGKTTTETTSTPGPSVAGSVLGTLGSLVSAFL